MVGQVAAISLPVSTERARLCDDAMGLGSLLFATLLGTAGRVGSVLASQKFSYLKEGHWHTIAVNQCKIDGRKEEHTSIKDVRPLPMSGVPYEDQCQLKCGQRQLW